MWNFHPNFFSQKMMPTMSLGSILTIADTCFMPNSLLHNDSRPKPVSLSATVASSSTFRTQLSSDKLIVRLFAISYPPRKSLSILRIQGCVKRCLVVRSSGRRRARGGIRPCAVACLFRRAHVKLPPLHPPFPSSEAARRREQHLKLGV